MALEDVVDWMDTIVNFGAFLAMFSLTIWILVKYSKQGIDKFFFFCISMYPLSYFVLMIGAILYFNVDSEQEND